MSPTTSKGLPSFPVVEIRTERYRSIGALYFETDGFVVLLNSVNADGDYGPLKTYREKHLVPESNATVYPRHMIKKIVRLKERI